MEIGDNISASGNFLKDSALDTEKIKECHSVICINNDGLSIAVFNTSRNHILAIGNYEWPAIEDTAALLARIESILLNVDLNFEDCISLKWILSGNRVSLIPQNLYKEGSEDHILKFSSRKTGNDIVKQDIWTEQQAASIYLTSSAIRDWITLNYSGATIYHSSTALKNLYNYFPQQGFFAILMVGNSQAELFLANQGRVVFYNYFTFGVEEDLLYYILFALEQNRILAPEIKLHIGGKLHKRQKLWILLEDYIGDVTQVEVPSHFQLSPALNKHTIYRYINLLGGL